MRWGTLSVPHAGRWTSALSGAHGARARLAIALLPAALYLVVFVLAYPQLGLALAAVATVPVSMVAYLWGSRAGVIAGIAFSPIHMTLLAIVFGEPAAVALQGGTGPGSLMLVGVGLIVGRMADMGRQIRAHQSVLVAEREALRQWQARYSELVTTLTAGNEVQELQSGRLLVEAEASDASQFRRFLGLIIVVAGVFGAAELTFGLLLSLPMYVILGLLAFAYGAAAFAARRALDHQVPLAALASGLAVGLVLAGLGAAVLAPAQSSATAFVPVLAGALGVRFVSGRALRRLLGMCWAGSAAITTIGEVALPASLIAGPFDALIRLAGVPAVAGLILYMLAAHSSRQRATLEVLDRRHREASLAEIRYRSLFNGLPIGLYRTTPGGRFLDANAAMVEMLGFANRDDLLAASVPAVYVDEADRDAWCAEIERSGLVLAAELEMRRPDGTRLWIRDTAHLVRGPSGEPLYFEGAAEDITEPKRLEGQLRHQAFHDPLTGLANRRLLLERLQQAIAAGRADGTRPAVLFIDLDDFKLINDSLGHDVGDRVLPSLATRLVGSVRPNDTVARLAGDEFTVLLGDAGSRQRATEVAERLLAELVAPLSFADREVAVSASIGISVGGGYAEEALGQADIAMYAAKRAGKARYALYDPSMREEAWRRLEIEAQLRGAADRGELVVHYQPIVDLHGGHVRAVEALVRWRHPTLGLLPPGAFIDAAEKTGHVTAVSAFVLGEACRQAAAWRGEPGLAELGVSVNLSAVDVREGSLTDAVRQALRIADLEASALCVEITESSLLADSAVTDRVLHELRDLGVRLAIDDFGAGFSNLSYLKRLAVDELKIDRSLVSAIPAGPRDEAVLRAAVAFGKTLGHLVTLEGVETHAQLEAAIRVGADAVQGYAVGLPGEPGEIGPMLVATQVTSGSMSMAVGSRGGR